MTSSSKDIRPFFFTGGSNSGGCTFTSASGDGCGVIAISEASSSTILIILFLTNCGKKDSPCNEDPTNMLCLVNVL